jgi:FkbM family methyltransferase
MKTALMKTAAHGLGSLRMGRRAVPGIGRVVDGLGRLACRVGGDLAVTSPWPGVRFETDLTDRIQRQMWAGVYEPHVRECFNLILEPGAVYFDVGAHIGFHAVFAAHRVGKQGRVFAFEADPCVYERLARNLSQFPWAQAVNAAVWDRTGSLTFERSSTKSESGWGTVSALRDFGKGQHVEIPSLALDGWCRDLRLERWDAMKLDAEGSELAVLRGAQSLLEKFRPSLILEINSVLLEEGGASASSVANFLLERGYRLFRLGFRGLEPWEPATQTDFCEALCLPGERTDEILKRLATEGYAITDACNIRESRTKR